MDRKQRFYVYLTAIFVAALLVSDLIGGKYFRVGGLDFSVGMIPFPLTFLLTDIVNEFYGTEGARRLTFVGLGVALFVFVIINVAIALPVSPESPMRGDQFKAVFGWGVRLYIASITAYVVGQLLDISIFFALRKLLAVDLLIVDDFGLDAMDATESRDAHEILTERDRKSTRLNSSHSRASRMPSSA